MDAEIRETSRTSNTSKVYVKVRKRGTYVGSIIFQECCFSKIARCRGYQFYTILSVKDLKGCKDCEWENEYVLGFLKSRSDHPGREFRAFKTADQKFEVEDINESSLACGFFPVPDTPFGRAVYYGHSVEVEKMLSGNKALSNERNSTGYLPLHIAVAEGHLKLVENLILSGADINGKGMYGESPLHLAVYYNRPQSIKLLLNNKADPDGRMEWGTTPLHIAAYKDRIEIAEMVAAAGANINAADDGGNTPLHAAASRGHLEILKFLISMGADPKTPNKQGQNPLHIAEAAKQQDAVNYLKQFK